MKKLLVFLGILITIIAIYFFVFSKNTIGNAKPISRNFITSLSEQNINEKVKGAFGISSCTDSLVVYTDHGAGIMDTNLQNLRMLNLPGSDIIYMYVRTPSDTAYFDAGRNTMVYRSRNLSAHKKIDGMGGRALFHKGIFYYDVSDISDLKHPRILINKWNPNTNEVSKVADLMDLFSLEISSSDTLCFMKTLEGIFFGNNDMCGYLFYFSGRGLIFTDTGAVKFSTVDNNPFLSFKERRFSLGDGREASACKAEKENFLNYNADFTKERLIILTGAIGATDSAYNAVDLYGLNDKKYIGSYEFRKESSKVYPLSIAIIRDQLFVLYSNQIIRKFALPS